tara:strand:+ start:921 stop:1061 length:141 start_codon:yes stop_codon:yes gene_type:complete
MLQSIASVVIELNLSVELIEDPIKTVNEPIFNEKKLKFILLFPFSS